MTVINNVHESFGQSLLLHCATSAIGIVEVGLVSKAKVPGLGMSHKLELGGADIICLNAVEEYPVFNGQKGKTEAKLLVG
ncbi:MAG: hypothetical protein RIE86_19555 [Imperialibacter sp.]|uniref:hypothetical protein n=1 Tax=Imperialibacter sp. TaxID=2038411 RepID=UPI0032EB7A44